MKIPKGATLIRGNMVFGTLNQIFVSGSYTEIKFSKQ